MSALAASAEPADILHIAAVALGFVDFFLGRSRRARDGLVLPQQLRAGQRFPDALSMEFGASCYLVILEKAALLGDAENRLPSAKIVLESIEVRLRDSPESFWTNPTSSSQLHDAVRQRWENYQWGVLESANVAANVDQFDIGLQALADFLWNHRHLAREKTSEASGSEHAPAMVPSLFAAFDGKPRMVPLIPLARAIELWPST